jgi:hypothetical protein
MNRYVSPLPWSPADAEILVDPPLRSCYLLIFRPRFEEFQSLAPDLFLPCARSRNLRCFYEDAGDLGCLLNTAGKLHRQARQVEVRHAAEVLAGMTDRVHAIGAPR